MFLSTDFMPRFNEITETPNQRSNEVLRTSWHLLQLSALAHIAQVPRAVFVKPPCARSMNKTLLILVFTALAACDRGADPATSQRLDKLEQRLQQLEKDVAELTGRLEEAPRAANPAAAVLGQTAGGAKNSKATRCLSNAKQIGTACKLYAMDHRGAFPNDLNELIPDYLPDRKVFSSPLAPKPEQLDYEYFGAGLKETDSAAKILLRGRYTTEDGERSVVRVDISGKVERQ